MSRASKDRVVHTIAALTIAAVSAGAQQTAAVARQPGGSGLEPRARAAHAVNRLTFGPRPGDLDRVAKVGVETWIAQQLSPTGVLDSATVTALDGCPQWTESLPSAVASMSNEIAINRQSGNMMGNVVGRLIVTGSFLHLVTSDSAKKAGPIGEALRQNAQLFACRLARVETSDQQLLEVMTDFWENHFSISSDKLPTRGAIIEWDRGVIRPNALGRFRDLLGAVAHSPAMLRYLDNDVNSADSSHPTLTEYVAAKATNGPPRIGSRTGLNENYARELLELHTLGVDGGYTQNDIIDVARALTGWTQSLVLRSSRTEFRISRAPASFVFDSATHDADAKTVLGTTLAAGRGIEDGNDVLDMLARHPSTARFIARKLAVRFVSDAPPAALVERAAATYLRTSGDIREVLRTIVTSPEFWSPEAFRAKVKTPVQYVLSLRRAMGAPPDTAAETIDFLVNLSQAPFSRASPDGWPEVGSAWMTAGTMKTRVDIATRIAFDGIASIPIDKWPAWKQLEAAPFEQQLGGVVETLLDGQVSSETRAVLLTARPVDGTADIPGARRASLRELVAFALSSPEFQRR